MYSSSICVLWHDEHYHHYTKKWYIVLINKHLVMHGKLFNGIFKPTGLTKYFWDSLHCVFAEHKGLAVPGHNGCAGVTLLCCVGARRLQITFLRKQPLCLQAAMCCPVPDNP